MVARYWRREGMFSTGETKPEMRRAGMMKQNMPM